MQLLSYSGKWCVPFCVRLDFYRRLKAGRGHHHNSDLESQVLVLSHCSDSKDLSILSKSLKLSLSVLTCKQEITRMSAVLLQFGVTEWEWWKYFIKYRTARRSLLLSLHRSPGTLFILKQCCPDRGFTTSGLCVPASHTPISNKYSLWGPMRVKGL